MSNPYIPLPRTKLSVAAALAAATSDDGIPKLSRSVFLRMTKAEQQLRDCDLLVAAFRTQTTNVPEEHPLRIALTQVLDAFEKVLQR